MRAQNAQRGSPTLIAEVAILCVSCRSHKLQAQIRLDLRVARRLNVANDWYYKLMGEEIGPLTSTELRQHALDGRVTPDTHIRRGESDRWVGADSVKGLFDKPAQPEDNAAPLAAVQSTLDAPAPPSRKSTEVSAPPSLPSRQTEDSPPQPTRTVRPRSVLIWVIGGATAVFAVLVCFAIIPRDPSPEQRFSRFTEHVSRNLEGIFETGTVSTPVQFTVVDTDRTKAPYAAKLTLSLTFPAGVTDYEVYYAYRDDKWVCEQVLAIDDKFTMDVIDAPEGQFVPLLKDCRDF